jgi:hypothetical protein
MKRSSLNEERGNLRMKEERIEEEELSTTSNPASVRLLRLVHNGSTTVLAILVHDDGYPLR